MAIKRLRDSRPKAPLGALLPLVSAGIQLGTQLWGQYNQSKLQNKQIEQQNKLYEAQQLNQANTNTAMSLNNYFSTEKPDDPYHIYEYGGKSKAKRRLRHRGKTKFEVEPDEYIYSPKGLRVTDGGIALPVGNGGYYIVDGFTHDQVNEKGKTGVGVEIPKNGEAIVFSDKVGDVIEGMGPATAAMSGYPPSLLYPLQEGKKQMLGIPNTYGYRPKALFGYRTGGKRRLPAGQEYSQLIKDNANNWLTNTMRTPRYSLRYNGLHSSDYRNNLLSSILTDTNNDLRGYTPSDGTIDNTNPHYVQSDGTISENALGTQELVVPGQKHVFSRPSRETIYQPKGTSAPLSDPLLGSGRISFADRIGAAWKPVDVANLGVNLALATIPNFVSKSVFDAGIRANLDKYAKTLGNFSYTPFGYTSMNTKVNSLSKHAATEREYQDALRTTLANTASSSNAMNKANLANTQRAMEHAKIYDEDLNKNIELRMQDAAMRNEAAKSNALARSEYDKYLLDAYGKYYDKELDFTASKDERFNNMAQSISDAVGLFAQTGMDRLNDIHLYQLAGLRNGATRDYMLQNLPWLRQYYKGLV